MLRYVGISVAYLEVFVERCCIHGGILLALSVLFNPFVPVHDTQCEFSCAQHGFALLLAYAAVVGVRLEMSELIPYVFGINVNSYTMVLLVNVMFLKSVYNILNCL